MSQFSTVETFQFKAPFPSRSGEAHFVVHMVKTDSDSEAKLLIAVIHHEGTDAYTREEWRDFVKSYYDNQHEDFESWTEVDAVNDRIFSQVHKFECPQDSYIGGYYHN